MWLPPACASIWRRFLKDALLHKQAIRRRALAQRRCELIDSLAHDWLRDTGQPVPAVVASRVMQPAAAACGTGCAR